MTNPATIMITMPKKLGDPTEYTFQWATKAIKIAKSLGYNVVDIKEQDTTYENVSRAIEKYKPTVFAHFGHGCTASLQGNTECVLTRKFSVDELICMAESPYLEERQKLLKLLNPLGQLNCPGICSLDNDPCSLLCQHDTNINLLKGSIVFAVACHSALQLGPCSIKYGVETYVGYEDLLMFPVDSMKSENMFGDVQLSMFKEILMGKTVQEAQQTMSDLEDHYIRKYKKIKYIALPLLWNKLKRKTLGNANATIYK